ncbi:MAG: hypothetical protein GX237_11385 [Clostridiales bacterium]|nr:hypothetical protein [Clostridiales bacterium]
MSKNNCCEPKEPGKSSVNISVDVTRIVKYACCTAVVIVGIIFGTKCFYKMMKKDFCDLDYFR